MDNDNVRVVQAYYVIIKNQPFKKWYANLPLEFLLGIGQGMGWSPTICSISNDITLDLMERHVPGDVYKSPMRYLEVFSILEAYVDDIHGSVNELGVRRFNEEYRTQLALE